MELFAGTVLANNTLFAGTVPENNTLFAGTVVAKTPYLPEPLSTNQT